MKENVTLIPGGYSQKNWVGVCGPLPKTLTLFMTKICDFRNPIYDLTENLIPYGGGHVKEAASSKFKYTKIDTLFNDENGQNRYPVYDQNG